MATVTANINLMGKIASLMEVKKLIRFTPRDMAVYVTKQHKENELNFGGTEPDVVVKIGRISGNLARSFDVVQVDEFTYGVQQNQSIAPYAGDVEVYAMRRFGMTSTDSVRRRTHDYLLKEALDEFEYAMKLIAANRPFTYHPLYGE